MTEAWESALRRAAARTFEDLAFLMPVPEDAGEAPAWTAGASVAFSGPLSGRLELRVCASLLPVLAENMLGDEAPSEAEERDALGEMANVICGNVLPDIGGREAVFRLEAPTPVSGPGSAGASVCVVLPLDAGRAEVRLSVDGPPDVAAISRGDGA